MIVKPSTKADECAAIASFIASTEYTRLPDKMRKEIGSRQRGLEGERSTAHILDREFHNAPDHALLHDLRLPDGIGGFAQFDHVILSRLSRTAAVIEVKNYRGRLSKNQQNEWCVWYEGRRRPVDIPNPLAQARRQREVLRAWLSSRRHEVAFQTIGAFVIIPPECSLDRSKIGTDVAIYKADNFVAEWMEFGGISPLGRFFSSGVSAKTLVAIGGQLAADHQPDERGIAGILGLLSTPDKVSGESFDDDAEEDEAITPVALPHQSEDHPKPSLDSSTREAVPLDAAVELEPTPVTLLAPARQIDMAAQPDVTTTIHERELPTGQIAFFAGKNDQVALERLKEACQGRAKWNGRSQRWICDDDRALEIKQILSARLATIVGPRDKSSPFTSVEKVTLPAPPPQVGDGAVGATKSGKPSRKAGELVEISPGISKRALPDGRVAFLAAKDDAGAIERVRSACQSRGQWKPLFGNWVCEGDVALLVEQAIVRPQGYEL